MTVNKTLVDNLFTPCDTPELFGGVQAMFANKLVDRLVSVLGGMHCGIRLIFIVIKAPYNVHLPIWCLCRICDIICVIVYFFTHLPV